MVENGPVPNKKAKVCMMRHSETSYIAEYRLRKKAFEEAGKNYDTMTEEERKQHELEFNEHSMQSKFIDDYITEDGIVLCEQALTKIIDTKLHSIVFVSPFRRTI